MGATASGALSRHSAHLNPPRSPPSAPAAAMPPAGSQDSAQTVDPAEQRRDAAAAATAAAADDGDCVPPSDDELPSLPEIGDDAAVIGCGDAGGAEPAAEDAPAAERAALSPTKGCDAEEDEFGGAAPVTSANDVKKKKPTPKKLTPKKKPALKKSLLKTKKTAGAKATKGNDKAVSKRATEQSEDDEAVEEGESSDGDDDLLLKKPAAGVSKKKTPPPKAKLNKLVKKTTPPAKKPAAEKGKKKAPASKRALADIDSSDDESDVEAGATSPALKESTNRVNLTSASKRKSAPQKVTKKQPLKKSAVQSAAKPGKTSAEKKRKSTGDVETEESPTKKTKSGAMKQRLQLTKVAPSKRNISTTKAGSSGKSAVAKPAKVQKSTKSAKAKRPAAKKKSKVETSEASDYSDDESDVDVADDEEEDTVVSDAEEDEAEEGAVSPAKKKSLSGVGVACSSSDEVSVGLIEAACTQLHGYVACDANKADIFVRSPDSKRTGSLLLAIARGIPVVDTEWLSSSIENGKFEKDLSLYESHVGAKAARLSRESTNSAGFLKRARVKIVGEPMSDADLLRQIVRHCGGKIVQDREHFAVVASGCDGVSGVENPVSMKYLADSIEQQKLLPEAEYRPSAVST